MQGIVEAKNVSFTYGNKTVPTVCKINFSINKGDFILITGQSGCGKSTILKMLNGLIPHESGGSFSGDIYIAGKNTRDFSIADLSSMIGLVFQSPEDQIFSATIFDEVAFVLENMGLETEQIKLRVQEVLKEVGLSGKEKDSIHALSGGQKQRLAVASVLAAKPSVLALDEPISQLDPVNAENLLQVLTKLNQEHGITIILIEHRLHEVIRVCNRMLIMETGKIVWDGTMKQALENPQIFSGHGLRLPQTIDLCSQLGIAIHEDYIADAVQGILKKYPEINTCKKAINLTDSLNKKVLITIENLGFGYENQPRAILNNFNLTVHRGEIIALMGTNGAGKSTLLQLIAGIFTPQAGRISIDGVKGSPIGTVGMVMQNPDLMLFNPTVRQEISYAAEQFGKNDAANQRYCESLCSALALSEVVEEFPLALSRGQRLRVAIASILGFKPAIVLLDEPTTGQDISRIEDILAAIHHYANEGGTVIFCTHDTEIAARFAERIVVMTEGKIVADGKPEDVFSNADILAASGLKQPPIIAMSQQLGIGKITSVEEVVLHVQQTSFRSHSKKHAVS